MQEERKHKKADIKDLLDISLPTLEKTMEDCGIDKSNHLHTDSELETIKKARQIMDSTRSRAKVREYFSTQSDMKDAKPKPTEQDLWGNGQSASPVDVGGVSDSTILDFFRQYQAKMGAVLAAAAPSMAAELHDAFNLMVMASLREEYQSGTLAKTLEMYKKHFEQNGDISQLLAKRQALQSEYGAHDTGGTTFAGLPMSEDAVDATPEDSSSAE